MKTLSSAILAGLILVAGGCANPGETPAAEGAVLIRRGASGAAIRAALGKPDRIQKVKENPAAEIWTYRRPVEQKVRMIEPTLQDVPVMDITNLRTGMTSAKAPVQHVEATTIEEVVVLLMVNDQLTEWSRSYRNVLTNQAVR